jgi:hypothetical protein
MQPLRVRFTMRRMMLAIAAMAILLALGRGFQSAYYRQIAMEYARLEVESYNIKGPVGERLRQSYAPLRRQYEEAASYPFPPVRVEPHAWSWLGDLLRH